MTKTRWHRLMDQLGAPARRMRASILLAIAVCTGVQSNGHAQQDLSDWLIVPGERVGPITAGTSEEMLRAVLGAENVVTADVYIGEGFSEPGTSVYPDDPAQHLEIIWRDATRVVPTYIRLTGDSSRWHTAEGVSLGSTLKEIEQLNGFPFRLAGFAWDYGGTILGCGRGRLRMLGCMGDDGVRQNRSIGLRLNPSADANAMPEYGQVQGDKEFSSGHPAMQALNPSVYQMIVTLEVVE